MFGLSVRVETELMALDMFGPSLLEELGITFMFTTLDKRSGRASLDCSGLTDFSEGRVLGSLLAVLSASPTV
jgi:hypothetical protein